MVNEKQTKRERNIKSKLMAAIAMLLVSSIMMVSTTYAWFTLSTAPEVKGITTAVGANGNLEMALLPAANSENVYYNSAANAMAAITSDAGDSMYAAGQDKEEANITWGNLVDLSPESYHMGEIVLYPSRLPSTSTTALNLTTGILETPTYGADGRVNTMKPVTGTGTYANGGFFNGQGYGVRAIGNVSGMTAREQAFVTATAAAAASVKSANERASTILNNAGTSLATMAMRKALDDGATFTKAEVQVLLDAYTQIETGPVASIKKAILEYTVAAYLNNVADDAMSDELMSTIRAVTDLNGLSTALNGANIGALAEPLNTAIAAFTTLESDVSTNKSGLTELLKDKDENAAFTWEQIKDYATALADTSGMTLNGMALSELTKKNDDGSFASLDTLMGMVTSGKGFVLDVTDGKGVYGDLASFVGKITGNVVMKNVKVPGLNGTVPEIPATMNINHNGTTYMDGAKNAVGSFKATEGADASTNPISDFYGYIIDMAFRTNAADSVLKLQTVGVDRIYNGNTANPATMGGGSTMTFSGTSGSASAGATTSNIPNLMGCIRVIFFDPDTGAIFGYARLDAEELSTQDDIAAGTVSYTMPLKMCDAAGVFRSTGIVNDDAMIVGLNQNEAKTVSVMVYLDGEKITNAEASTKNINGTMNLQFSSSAELQPMKYDDLKTGTNTPAAPEGSDTQG